MKENSHNIRTTNRLIMNAMAYMRMVVIIQAHMHFDDLADVCYIWYAKCKTQGNENVQVN